MGRAVDRCEDSLHSLLLRTTDAREPEELGRARLATGSRGPGRESARLGGNFQLAGVVSSEVPFDRVELFRGLLFPVSRSLGCELLLKNFHDNCKERVEVSKTRVFV